MTMNAEEVVQALVVADLFDNSFQPLNPNVPMAFIPVLGEPLVNYALESLAQQGVGETILFCSQNGLMVKEYIRKCTLEKVNWSLSMAVQVVISETCRSLGDVMREIDASGLIRSHFILMGINSISNVNLLPLFEKHKQTFKKDKTATMTVLYKKVSWGHKLICPDQVLFLVSDSVTKRVLLHQKIKPGQSNRTLTLPLEIILNHSEVQLHHNLVDTNIAFCAPTVLPLYADNFDFQSCDDFVKGILLNEEVMTNTLYHIVLDGTEYATAITNWNTYRTISRDILHHRAYPLIKRMFVDKKDKYVFMDNHIYRSKSATLNRSCVLGEDVLIGADTRIDENTKINRSVIGDSCQIGKHVIVEDSHILKEVIIEDNCVIRNSYIGNGCTVQKSSVIENGTIITDNNIIKANSKIINQLLTSAASNEAHLKQSETDNAEWDNESADSNDEDKFVGYNQTWDDSGSEYSSVSSELSALASPIPDDTNIFLQEVIDSLARGFDEKLNCDYLILEINSSRYAYNMQLHEVNFHVVRAVLSLPAIAESKNVLATIKSSLKYFKPILDNYIKTKSAIMDCLNAVEECCSKCKWLEDRCGQVLHLLYEADVVDEESLTEWYEDLKADEKDIAEQNSVIKFFKWLEQASEESESE